MKRKRFNPPKDVKQWWLAPHCGEGSLDPQEDCGFCGESHLDCALSMTLNVKAHPDWYHDLCEPEQSPDDQQVCYGSGFWCGGCGRFWAQDSCGECYALPEYHAADGLEIEVRDGKAFCVCGKQLAVIRPDHNEEFDGKVAAYESRLKELGFALEHQDWTVKTYKKGLPDGRVVDVQLWEDGGHRAHHSWDGCSATLPTDFDSLEGMMSAIATESTRLDSKYAPKE